MILFSILLRVAGLVWSLLLWRRLRDRRLGFFVATFALMALRQALTSLRRPTATPWAWDEVPGLVVSALMLAAVVAVGRMIDEAQRARREAMAHEARFRVLVENAPEAIVVFDVDQRRFVDGNRNAERLFGLSLAELTQHGPADLSPPRQPDGRSSEEGAREALEAALEGSVEPFEWVHRDAGGRDRVCEVRLVRLPASDRRLVRGSVIDLTEKKAAAHEVAKHQDRLRMALAAAQMGIWEWDLERDRLAWSAEIGPFFGLEPRPLEQTMNEFLHRVHPEDAPPLREALRRTIDEEHPYEVQYRVPGADGVVRWLHSKGRLVRSSDGEGTRLAGTVMDVSELKRLESKLLHTRRMELVGRLAGGIAHDFNNLLTAILGEVDLARADLGPDEPMTEILNAIRDAGEGAARLTRQLLAFARRQVFELRVVDLVSMFGDLSRMLSRLVGEDVRLEIEAAPVLWPVRVDVAQIEQVLVNLVVNAREAMPRGGLVTIRAENVEIDGPHRDGAHHVEDGSYVRIEVRDAGLGMSPEVRERAFEPFFTTRQGGTGLGLSTCQGIVVQHGGQIWIESREAGGTVVTILLPRAVDDLEEGVEEPPADRSEGSEGILVVEDDARVRELEVTALEGMGYRVLAVSTGEEAVELLARRSAEVDVIVSDVVLPGLRGPELASEVRHRWPRIRVLLVSGYADTWAESGSEADLPFLAKPFTGRELARRIRDLLETRGGAQEP